ncbi:hypothetical protein Cgig2_015943 [Carnegiea gigantea]|uniref:eRF1/Pelota-like N-terminal domain-containing protein n=1 Tax=Carnegiea gigantea TaxID=171969 RepID=A0A9Q1QKY2_9CARY|nr:hypothetical protein Cgig2_015943 [Carnegiea gigantea]
MRVIEGPKLQIYQPGAITIIPEEQDDLWILSNLILPNDVVCAETSRKVHPSGTGSGGKNPVRVRFTMEVKITGVDYDNGSSSITVSGKIITNKSYVTAGAFHTLELVKGKAFELKKKSWDSISIENLKEGCNKKSGCDLVVLLINPGLAHLYMVGKSMTNSKIWGKKVYPSKFFERVFNALVKNVDFSVLHCMVIAGPGSTKDQFRQFYFHKHVGEVLDDPRAMSLIKDTKSATELRAMKELNEMMLFHHDKACYGPKSVDFASELMAIETLLITDDMFRNVDSALRKKYIGPVDSVKRSGGKVLVLSSMHVSGEQLTQLTGIAAILRFPVPDIDELELRIRARPYV